MKHSESEHCNCPDVPGPFEIAAMAAVADQFRREAVTAVLPVLIALPQVECGTRLLAFLESMEDARDLVRSELKGATQFLELCGSEGIIHRHRQKHSDEILPDINGAVEALRLDAVEVTVGILAALPVAESGPRINGFLETLEIVRYRQRVALHALDLDTDPNAP